MLTKKARWLLLLLPIIAGVLWMRSLASWRPKVVFAATTAAAGAVTKLKFSSDGQTLLVAQEPPPKLQSGDTDLATLTALDGRNFRPIWQRDAMNSFGNPRFFADDSKVLVNGGQIMILDARDGQPIREFDLAYGAAISPDGKWIAVGDFDADGRVYINSPDRDIPNGPQGVGAVHVLGESADTARAFEFSPDGKTLVVGRGDKGGAYLDFYDTQTWKRTRVVNDEKVAPETKGRFPFYQEVSWSHDGQMLMSKWSSNEQDRLHLWRLSNLKNSMLWNPDTSPQFTRGSQILAFSLIDGKDSRVYLSSASELPIEKRLLSLLGEVITSAAISPDGAQLFVGTKSGRVIRKRLK